MAVNNPGVTSVTATAPVTSSGGTAPNIALTTSGPNSVVIRDSNQNISVNSISEGYVNVAAAGTTTVLTVASAPNYVVTGSGGQTYQLPNATTLPNGVNFTFNNNQSSGAITVNNNSGTLIVSVPSGAFVDVSLLSNAIAAGSWDTHFQAPSNVSWSTNTFSYGGSITNATWNGNTIAINRGGTGASTKATAFNALSPMSAAGDVIYGGTSGAGTALPIGTAGQVLTVNSGATAPQWSTPTTGTVTSVSTTGTVNGITLTGGPITSSGTITLGGTLDLSSPPAIGSTAANTGAFTTLSASSTVSGTGFSTYLASPPAIGGTTAAAGTFTTLISGGGSANYQQEVGAATGFSPIHSVAGSDTNISQVFQSKGTTGAIDLSAQGGVNISNGGTVTALTRTTSGSNYTTNPTPSITAPTTAGGVQATATSTISCGSATVSAGGSGYVVGEILTVVGGTSTVAAVLTVATVSGTAVATVNITTNGTYTASPTNPAATTSNLSGTGATFTLNFSVSSTFSITNAGSGYVEQPTVTFSGGGGSGAAAYATVGSVPKITSLGGDLSFYTPGGEAFRVGDGAQTTVNYIAAYGATSSGNTPQLLAAGTSGTLNLRLSSKSSGSLLFATNSNAQQQMVVSHTASAVNYVQVTGAATNNGPEISSQGSDASVSINYSAKNAGNHIFKQAGGTNFRVNYSVTAPVNYLAVTGSLAGISPVFSSQGSDASISMVLQPKNTGAIDLAAGSSGVNISNGGTVTALTRTANGSAYTSPPTVAISAPTTAGGVQATATSALAVNVGTPTITSGGTGYSVGDVLTFVGGTNTQAVQLTVSTVSSGVITAVTVSLNGIYTVLPSNPISTTVSPAGGTGATFTATTQWGLSGIFTITAAGSGYVEQPTVTFSGGGGSGAAAYATVGAEPTIKSLFGGATTSGLAVATSGGTQVKFVDVGDGTRPIQLFGGSSTQAGGIFQPTSVATIAYSTNTGPHIFYTGGRSATEQARVSHTSSAVNYVQVTGSTTGNSAIISTQGSDSAVSLQIQAKSGGVIRFVTGNATSDAFRIGSASSTANYMQALAGVAGAPPVLSSQGSDTDISLALFPKGLGIVLMNQQTPTAVTATGTLTIANLLTQIITSTSAVAVALTLPTGTLSDAGVSGGTSAANTSFDYSIINTGSAVGDVTLVAGTGHTIVGSVTVPVGTTGNFRCRKTATNTFVSYRV